MTTKPATRNCAVRLCTLTPLRLHLAMQRATGEDESRRLYRVSRAAWRQTRFEPIAYTLLEDAVDDALERATELVPFDEIEGELACRAYEDDLIASGHYDPYDPDADRFADDAY